MAGMAEDDLDNNDARAMRLNKAMNMVRYSQLICFP
jgi:hypothetical protein